ncbi:gliding motility-associated C-terminal domain-containing protein [uncultured Maribacter sp.]|uniref:gliding motility-associated C-terminal domain-containing protein n=1 Tax=uncultured Maribacter sp. TaxID=431308 RepID=UPI002622D609|nr:gliding motility-associated C-terminal domain-containing protein [uncultured Maribacter sp.]
MNNQNKLTIFLRWFIFLIMMNYTIISSAQCAGSDVSITVCEKDSDVANRTFDLFAVLTGEDPGGVWSTQDPVNIAALNPSTGVVDLWSINNFGAHEFTYTNDACGESAIVTINLGGYPGENNTDGSANACGDDESVNLHGFLGSNTAGKVQDFNGTWAEVPAGATGNLDFSSGNFNASATDPGVYTFTYTVDAIMDGATVVCPSRFATIEVEVHDPRTAGEPSSITFCTTDDFSTYTNFDLHDLLTGESMIGSWEQTGSYGQITSTSDSFVNIQELRDLSTEGGSYIFTYNAPRSHPVCSDSSSDVTIIILPALEETLASNNYCVGEDYTVDISYDATLLPNASYEIEYTLSDGVSATQQLDTIPFSGGTANFDILAGLVTPNTEYDVTISNIRNIGVSDVCNDIPVPGLSFIVSNSDVDIADVCITTDGSVDLTNILDDTKVLKNGAFDVTYTLTDAASTQTTYTATAVDFVDGDATFAIPSANLTTLGNYGIEISVANELNTNCVLAATFELLPTPSDMTLDLTFDNSCNTSTIDVIVDAPVLSTGEYTITYEVTALGDTAVLLSNTEITTGTTQTFPFDVSSLADGNYTVTVTSTQTDTTPCRTVFDFSHSIDFARGGVSLPPTADMDQTFCLEDFMPVGPTIADIMLTASGTIRFYDTATDTTILPDTTVLVDGEDYYIATIDLNYTCAESERIQVNVTVADPQLPTTTEIAPIFCATDNPTVADLDVQITGNEVLVWYDAATAGNIIDSSAALVDGQTYYAESEINNACQSATRLEVTPSVVGLTEPVLNAVSLSICQLDAPTVSELIALENIVTGWNVRWYDAATGGNEVSANDALVSGTNYYAESYNPASGCVIPTRIEVLVDLTDCNPEEHDFYIPDGFSPNGDGTNDTYFVPNIEVIFPEFTIEILNRYGNSLFKGDINNPAWDGTNNGNSISPNGVYFYIINYNKEGFSPKQGRIYLNR